jgi:uncharacterized protein YuzE
MKIEYNPSHDLLNIEFLPDVEIDDSTELDGIIIDYAKDRQDINEHCSPCSQLECWNNGMMGLLCITELVSSKYLDISVPFTSHLFLIF